VDFALTFVFTYLARSIIIKYLGEEYLGLSSLYSSILNVLNIAELGFASAIVYNLYEPIAQNDYEKANAIINFLKKAYLVIGLTIYICGLALCPFIKFIIKGNTDVGINIYLLFILYLTNVAAGYLLFAYKVTLLTALQRLDRTKKIYSLVNIFQYSAQIFSVIVLKNFYLYVVCAITGTVAKNIVVSYLVNKFYPEFKCTGIISKETRESIKTRIKGLLICKISAASYTSFDSVIVTSFLGLTSVAIYGNYMLVYYSATNLIAMLRQAMQASIGNKLACDSLEQNLDNAYLWQFGFANMACFVSICMLCLFQNFIIVWVGEEMTLPQIDIVLLSLLLYISTIQHSFNLYLTGAGMWWNLRYVYSIGAISNLVMNIILCSFLDTTGVILSTVISQLLFGYCLHTKILFKDLFKINVLSYHYRNLRYFAVYVCLGALMFFLCNLIQGDGWLTLILRSAICIVLLPSILLLLYRKNAYLKTLLGYIFSSLSHFLFIQKPV